MEMGYVMFSSDKKLEYFDFAGDPLLVHLTEVRCFGLAHKKLEGISEPTILRLYLVKAVGLSIIKAAQLRSQFRRQCHDTQMPVLAGHFAPARR